MIYTIYIKFILGVILLKFIHTADVHLGSQLNLNASADIIKERRAEIRTTFKNIVELAKREGATAILLSGDVFDGVRALKKDKEFFYNVVKNNPSIDFLYLRGNHDILEGFEESYPNLKLFSDDWTYYEYGDTIIAGIEMTNANANSMYQSLKLDESKTNVVMLHGQVADTTGNGLIHVVKFKDKNIDYLALGHVHSNKIGKIDNRGVYAYSGCPEGRGYDETGKKGVYLLDVENGKVNNIFIETAIREISLLSVDCTGLKDAYEIYSRIKEIGKLNAKNLYRIELYGEVDFDTDGIEEELSKYLSGECYLNSIKDKTVRKIDVSSLEGDVSLKGEFLRQVSKSDLTSEDKKRIISLGLKALSGREI